jgi:hypothetical protein
MRLLRACRKVGIKAKLVLAPDGTLTAVPMLEPESMPGDDTLTVDDELERWQKEKGACASA